MDKTIHQGRNVKRFREMLGIKQDALAYGLGDDWNQQKISLLEQKETIDAPLLQRVAEIMKLPVEAFKNMSDEQAITVISSTFNDNAQLGSVINNFNPVEAVLKLHDEKMALYERMLKEKDDMMARLEKLIEKK